MASNARGAGGAGEREAFAPGAGALRLRGPQKPPRDGSGGGGGGGGDGGKSAFDQLLTVFLGFKLISSINDNIKKRPA